MSAKDEKDEPYNFLREYIGPNDDQIQTISHGTPSQRSWWATRNAVRDQRVEVLNNPLGWLAGLLEEQEVSRNGVSWHDSTGIGCSAWGNHP